MTTTTFFMLCSPVRYEKNQAFSNLEDAAARSRRTRSGSSAGGMSADRERHRPRRAGPDRVLQTVRRGRLAPDRAWRRSVRDTLVDAQWFAMDQAALDDLRNWRLVTTWSVGSEYNVGIQSR